MELVNQQKKLSQVNCVDRCIH